MKRRCCTSQAHSSDFSSGGPKLKPADASLAEITAVIIPSRLRYVKLEVYLLRLEASLCLGEHQQTFYVLWPLSLSSLTVISSDRQKLAFYFIWSEGELDRVRSSSNCPATCSDNDNTWLSCLESVGRRAFCVLPDLEITDDH